MFLDQIWEQAKGKWVGWNLHIKLIMGIKILMQMLLQLENSKGKEESVEEDKQQVLVYLFLLDNF
jgi:hypothetical protein